MALNHKTLEKINLTMPFYKRKRLKVELCTFVIISKGKNRDGCAIACSLNLEAISINPNISPKLFLGGPLYSYP